MAQVTVRDQLDGYADRFPGCQVVILADLSTGLALATNSDARMPQENVDSICVRAAQTIDDNETAVVDRLFSRFGQGARWATVLVEPEGKVCAVTRDFSEDEALCIFANGDIPLSSALIEARNLLGRIANSA